MPMLTCWTRLTRIALGTSRCLGRKLSGRARRGHCGCRRCALASLRAARHASSMSGPEDRKSLSIAPFDTSGLANLDDRSREIFRRIVDSYLATGDPVGSRNLSRTLSVQLSPASVRNVMQDLEELGLVYAPHTSAGRMPTHLGLRFFVDALLEIGDLSNEERTRIETQI